MSPFCCLPFAGQRTCWRDLAKEIYVEVAAGADGLLVEIHPSPAHALSDGDLALNFDQFADLMRSIKTLLPHFGRTLNGVPTLAASPAPHEARP